MNIRCLVTLFVATAISSLILTGNSFAKTASCPCSPCKCSPCTCGGGGSKGGKHHDKEGRHEHGGVGVGVNVDLGGVGQRKAEPNPFAVGGGEKPVAHAQERAKTKKEGTPKTDAFSNVELTGEQAKDETGMIGGGGINVSNDTPTPPPQTQEKPKEGKKPDWAPIQDWVPPSEETPTPAPQTQEKPKENEKPKWPKPIQDWIDARKAVDAANYKLRQARWEYQGLLNGFFWKSNHWVDLSLRWFNLAAKKDATQADKDNAEKAKKEMEKQEAMLEKDFQKTEEGQKAYDPVRQAEKVADKAAEAEKEADKNLPSGVDKNAVLNEEQKPAKSASNR